MTTPADKTEEEYTYACSAIERVVDLIAAAEPMGLPSIALGRSELDLIDARIKGNRMVAAARARLDVARRFATTASAFSQNADEGAEAARLVTEAAERENANAERMANGRIARAQALVNFEAAFVRKMQTATPEFRANITQAMVTHLLDSAPVARKGEETAKWSKKLIDIRPFARARLANEFTGLCVAVFKEEAAKNAW